jgi:nucleoside triphosphate diphosphatase
VASALDEAPRDGEALGRALDLSARAAKVGFDWDDPAGVLDKLEEELAESREAIAAGQAHAVAAELGDVLFTVVNLARHLGVDPVAALNGTSDRFESRFRELERGVRGEGLEIGALDSADLERRWQAAKAHLARGQ